MQRADGSDVAKGAAPPPPPYRLRITTEGGAGAGQGPGRCEVVATAYADADGAARPLPLPLPAQEQPPANTVRFTPAQVRRWPVWIHPCLFIQPQCYLFLNPYIIPIQPLFHLYLTPCLTASNPFQRPMSPYLRWRRSTSHPYPTPF